MEQLLQIGLPVIFGSLTLLVFIFLAVLCIFIANHKNLKNTEIHLSKHK